MANDKINWQIHRKGYDAEALKAAIMCNMEYRLAKDQYSATNYDRFLSTAYSVVERLVERWIATQQTYHNTNPKRVYYFSMEYLLGKSLENSLINLGLYNECKKALAELDMDLEEIRNYEADAGLGNGGLGRLAACFLDSMATLCYPAQGYGIRYNYGLFHQKIVNGHQVETADCWLSLPSPWEIERPEYNFKVRFGGKVDHIKDAFGREKANWYGGEEVIAKGYDVPIPGYHVNNVNTLRLWSASASEEFDFKSFNIGEYISACEKKLVSENITKVLYPNDNFFEGKELRLKQEYLLVSTSLQDIIRRYRKENTDIRNLHKKVAIQLNDTHPALAIPELMRLLIDEHEVDWKTAWTVTTHTFAYTNHTVLPEALEEWPLELIEHLLPRILEIIYLINHNLLHEITVAFPKDPEKVSRMSIISEGSYKNVRMANLAVAGSHSVNGVAELHSRLVREKLLKDFYQIWPTKFNNKTNGITPRRWMQVANPRLSELITEAVGEGWLKDLEKLRELEKFADDPEFQKKWRDIKLSCKQKLADSIWNEEWLEIHPATMLDVQVKRIHEYKRQLLFALFMIAKYIELKENPASHNVPRTCIVGGKAAPGYDRAKLIIKFINSIAEIVNNDVTVSSCLRIIFLPNYRVSLAEKLIPAADLSEQISTAGKEASGTGNMKFALNGAVTLGTLDGANVEILEEVGNDNIFIFGLTEKEVTQLKKNNYVPKKYIAQSPLLQKVLNLIGTDFFSPEQPGLFKPLYDELLNNDEYLLTADFDAYIAAQKAVEKAYTDKARWTKMSILNVARCAKFSSDRTITEYARDIWEIEPLPIILKKEPE